MSNWANDFAELEAILQQVDLQIKLCIDINEPVIRQFTDQIEDINRFDCIDANAINQQEADWFWMTIQGELRIQQLDLSKKMIEVSSLMHRNKPLLFYRQMVQQRNEYFSKISSIDKQNELEEGRQLIQGQLLKLSSIQLPIMEAAKTKHVQNTEIAIPAVENKAEMLSFRKQDLEKLQPGRDLNDTIIDNYLKIIKNIILPHKTSRATYFFSSFFLSKLVGEKISFEMQMLFQQKQYKEDYQLEFIRQRVAENYKNVRRWTKKQDIFSKEILVFPVNDSNHWYSLLVLNPGLLLRESRQGKKCEIVYCDSLGESKEYIVEAIRMYLKQEFQAKKQKEIVITRQLIPYYHILLPRQTNLHDCGLYMLAYIEQLIIHKEKELQYLRNHQNRKKLHLFPRRLIFTLRHRLLELLINLSSCSEVERKPIFDAFLQKKLEILKEWKDYDRINEAQYTKYQAMSLCSIVDKTSVKQKQYACLVKFYLDPEVNYYQKDKPTD